MAHVRTQIRAALVAALIGASTAAGSRVFDSRVRVYQPDELPAINVESINEQSEPLTSGGGPIAVMQREYGVRITLHVSTVADDWATKLDDLAAQVETAIATSAFRAGGAQRVIPTSYDQIADDEGEATIARGVLEFSARYLTSQINPQTSA